MSRKHSKQIIGQSLISPISAPPRARETAWAGPEKRSFSPSIDPVDDEISHSIDNDLVQEQLSQLSLQPSFPMKQPVVQRDWEPMDLPHEWLPKILAFMDVKTLASFMTVSKLWSSTIFPMIYSHVSFGKNAGKALCGFLKLLAQDSQNQCISINYLSHVRSLSIQSIVFSEPGPLYINWKDVKELLSLCCARIEGLTLEFDDSTFLSLPLDYVWLDTETQFTNLESLTITSKNCQVPDSIAIELLRKCTSQMITHLEISQCLRSFEGTAWYLLLDKISPYIRSLTLTPTLKSQGWDAEQFQKGFHHIVKTSAFLKKVNIAGHRFGVSDHTLCILLELGSNLSNLTLPCGLNDTHLLALMSCTNIGRLCKLDMSCQCATGRFTEIKKEGWPCNRFTDSVLIALMEKLMADNRDLRKPLLVHQNGYQKLELVLPRFIMEVKSRSKIPTLQWATAFRGFVADYRDKDAIFYRGFRINAPGSRLIS